MKISNTFFFGKVLVEYNSIPSTNEKALFLLKGNKISEGTVILAHHQSAGRGQLHTKWESEAGQNLTFSLLLMPKFLQAKEQFLLSQCVALALVDFVSQYFEEVSIKWPNDIYIKDKKVAGVLIQNTILGKKIQSAVVGIGININQMSFSSEFPKAVSFAMLSPKKYDLEVLLTHLLQCLEYRYQQLRTSKYSNLNSTYQDLLYLRGQLAPFKDTQSDNYFLGKILGTNSTGLLEILVDEETHTFDLKSVQYL